MNRRRSRRSFLFACGVAGVIGLGASASGQSSSGKTLPTRPEAPELVVVKDWLASTSPFAAEIAITRSERGKETDTLAEGRVEISPDGTVHYVVTRTIRQHAPGEAATASDRLIKPDAEFWVRGQVVVLVNPGHGVVRLKMEDVAPKSDDKTDSVKSSAPTAELLAALGGDDEIAVERAQLVHCTAPLQDPRRCMSVSEARSFEATSLSGSLKTEISVTIPSRLVSRIPAVVPIAKANLKLEWWQDGGIRSAMLQMHTAANRSDPLKDDDYFDLLVAYTKLSVAELPRPPIEVEKHLTAEPPSK
jgi:hypothetical protein